MPHASRLKPHQRGQVVRGPSPAGYTSIDRPPNCQRPSAARSRRAARPCSVCHQNSASHRIWQFPLPNPSVCPRSPPPDRRSFARGRRRSTPGEWKGERTGRPALWYLGNVDGPQCHSGRASPRPGPGAHCPPGGGAGRPDMRGEIDVIQYYYLGRLPLFLQGSARVFNSRKGQIKWNLCGSS